MKKKRYIPDGDPKLKLWMQTFKTNIALKAATLGLAPAEVTELQNWCDDIISKINDVSVAKAAYKQSVSDKNGQRKISVDGITNKATGIKTLVTYTPGIGNDLGIIGEDDGFDPLTFKTKLKAIIYTDHVVIEFMKDQTDGINIYSRMKGAADWAFLALDTQSPYIDNRPLQTPGKPETREYMGIGVINDQQLPLHSEIISVVFGG